VRTVQEAAQLQTLPPLHVQVRSDIPIASGLGSGAATAAALIRALARHLRREDLARDERVAELTYEVEKIHHGTPSGIDNTVVALEKAVYFVRQQPQNRIETISVAQPLRFLVADTGERSRTRDVVGDVRQQWQAQPERFEELFAGCGRIARAGREALERGERQVLGHLMNQNQTLLESMTVSGLGLERLIEAARQAGAAGAKLSGAGRGGNMIALVGAGCEDDVRAALLAAGAQRVLVTEIGARSRQN
jgi:mevalonate kinase